MMTMERKPLLSIRSLGNDIALVTVGWHGDGVTEAPPRQWFAGKARARYGHAGKYRMTLLSENVADDGTVHRTYIRTRR